MSSISNTEQTVDRQLAENDLLQQMNWQLREMRFQLCSLHVRALNSCLSNPLLPITPAYMPHPVHGAIQPDADRFPRNARDFYQLKNPRTDHQLALLAYLVEFYGIQSMVDDGSSEDKNSTRQVLIIERPDLVVEVLEGILGLRGENFDNFRNRARQLAQEGKQVPRRAKRRRGHGQSTRNPKRRNQQNS